MIAGSHRTRREKNVHLERSCRHPVLLLSVEPQVRPTEVCADPTIVAGVTQGCALHPVLWIRDVHDDPRVPAVEHQDVRARRDETGDDTTRGTHDEPLLVRGIRGELDRRSDRDGERAAILEHHRIDDRRRRGVVVASRSAHDLELPVAGSSAVRESAAEVEDVFTRPLEPQLTLALPEVDGTIIFDETILCGRISVDEELHLIERFLPPTRSPVRGRDLEYETRALDRGLDPDLAARGVLTASTFVAAPLGQFGEPDRHGRLPTRLFGGRVVDGDVRESDVDRRLPTTREGRYDEHDAHEHIDPVAHDSSFEVR